MPLRKALRIMHTPENAVRCFGMIPPFFDLSDTKPVVGSSDGYRTLAFTYQTGISGKAKGALFARKADVSYYLLMDGQGTPMRFVGLKVIEADVMGYCIKVEGTWLREPTDMERVMFGCVPDHIEMQNVRGSASWDWHPDENVRAWHTLMLGNGTLPI